MCLEWWLRTEHLNCDCHVSISYHSELVGSGLAPQKRKKSLKYLSFLPEPVLAGEMIIKALTNRRYSSSLPWSAFSERGKCFQTIFQMTACMRFKLGSRDGQKHGSASYVRPARHWDQLAMLGVGQEHFCASYLNTDTGSLPSLFIDSLFMVSARSDIPQGSNFSSFFFMMCPRASLVLHL